MGDLRFRKKSPGNPCDIRILLRRLAPTPHTVTMANIQVAPTKNELEQMLRRGLTQQQIVAEWEEKTGTAVSRSAIAMAMKRYGLKSARPRPRHEDMLPWHVKDEHKNHIEARMLRMEGRRRKGLPLKEEDLRWLNNWRRQLDEAGAVVAYDPETDEGFFWIERKASDSDIIRHGRI